MLLQIFPDTLIRNVRKLCVASFNVVHSVTSLLVYISNSKKPFGLLGISKILA